MHGRRRPRVTLLVVAAIAGAAVGAVVGPQPTALACSCAETTLAEFVEQYPEAIVAAFTGTQTERIVEDEQADDGAVLTFDVDAVFTGDVGATYEVRTHAQSSACGLDVGRGALASVAVADFGGGPIVGLCSSLWSADELAAQFGPGREPVGVPLSPDTSSDTAADTGREDDPGAAADGPRPVTRIVLGAILLAMVVAALVVVRRQHGHRRDGPARESDRGS